MREIIQIPSRDEAKPVVHDGFAKLAVGPSEGACKRVDLAGGR